MDSSKELRSLIQRNINHQSINNPINQKTTVMKALLKRTPTESRRHTFFSNFKNSKRVKWSEVRHYVH
jgi:hypothetical protein